MKGYAVVIRRDDGSFFFSMLRDGVGTPFYLTHRQAKARAIDLRGHRFDAQVVKVEYTDPVIIGPKRWLGKDPS